MSTLAPLVAEVRACRLCAPQLPLGPRPVFQLHPAARILIAAQAPSRRVHQSGIPFDDASGDRLRSWLGVSRAVFYDSTRVAIVPIGLCFPGSGRAGDRPPRPECVTTWRARLLQPLQRLQLTLAIGHHAQMFHLRDAAPSVTERVKAWRQHWPTLMPLPHPSPRNNGWLASNPWFESELVPRLQRRVSEVLQ